MPSTRATQDSSIEFDGEQGERGIGAGVAAGVACWREASARLRSIALTRVICTA